MKNIFLLFTTLLILAACGSTKKTVYFQGIDEADIAQVITEYEVRIMPNDNLHITVSTINPDAAEIFNNINLSRGGNVNTETLTVMGYLVDSEGFINFPVLGKIHLGGLTKTQAINYLTERISVYVEDPVVNIRFINYKVTILGEVKNPGTYTIKDEKVTLLEAIGMAGDLTIFGKRDNILITRETDGIKTAHRLDLTSPEIFSSDYYYLQQNDVVYVQPNKARAGSSAYNQNLSLGVSLLSIVVTIALFIAN
ncbi:MAG: polysaccharide biosynthesis/export family protein [Rikenellaceae bacterium]|nr:polysaccharide biosynthesis/export family protein [Rikenellaceae bacterium]